MRRRTSKNQKTTPEPFRGYRPGGPQRSGPEFWAWFDSLPAADRRALNDYAGPDDGFRALVEQIALGQLAQLRRGT